MLALGLAERLGRPAVGRVELVGDLEQAVGGLRIVLELGAAALEEVVDLARRRRRARAAAPASGAAPRARRIVPVRRPSETSLETMNSALCVCRAISSIERWPSM